MRNILKSIYQGLFKFEITINDNLTENLEFIYPSNLEEGKEYILRKLSGKLEFSEVGGEVPNIIRIRSTENGEIWNIGITEIGELYTFLYAIVEDFIARVNADGGTYLANGTASDSARLITENTKLLLTPSAIKTGKLYSIFPEDGSGDFSVTRNSTAYYTDKDGIIKKADPNEVRIGYKNGYPQIVIEPEITPLFKHSNTFEDSVWNKSNSTVTANAGISPDGTNSAYRWLSNQGSTSHYLGQRVDTSSQETYVVSFYVKSNTGSNQLFRLFGANGVNNRTSPDMVATTNWQRFSFTFIGNDANAYSAIHRPSDDSPVDLLIWQADLIEGEELYNPIETNDVLSAQPADVVTTTTPSGVNSIIETSAGNSIIKDTIPTTYQIPVGRWDKIEMK